MKSLIFILFLGFTFQCVHMQLTGWYVGTVDNNKHFWTFPSNEDYLQVQDRCSWMHMHMAKIDSAEENELVANYLRNEGNFTISKKQFWAGATDLFDEGHWHWNNHYDEQMPYTNWYTGSTPPLNYSRNCMTIHPSGLWFDYECAFLSENYYYPLCESYDITPPHKNYVKHVKKSPKSARVEPRNMNFIGQANAKSFWIDADSNLAYTSTQWDFCHERGLNLISVESQVEFELIIGYLKSHGMTGLYATSAVPYYADYYYWMKTGEMIANSSYISVPENQFGNRLSSLCIAPNESIVRGCGLVGTQSIAICEIDL